MGYLLRAECNSCHWYHDTFSFGSGFANRKPKLPAINKATSAFIITDNEYDPALDYYHSPDMYKGEIEGFGIQHEFIRLNPEGNKCPGCGEYSMRFEVVGEWD